MLVNKSETLRYLGYGTNSPSASENELIDECIIILEKSVAPKAVYKQLPLIKNENGIVIGEIDIKSKALLKALSGCESALLFAATLGREADVLIRRESAVSIARAAVLQAASASAIEQFCDNKCDELSALLKENNLFLRPRFSPGYGDFSLSFQPELLNMLSAHKIGLSCTESLMLVPSKSVTAVIGVSNEDCRKEKSCGTCTKEDCAFKRA